MMKRNQIFILLAFTGLISSTPAFSALRKCVPQKAEFQDGTKVYLCNLDCNNEKFELCMKDAKQKLIKENKGCDAFEDVFNSTSKKDFHGLSCVKTGVNPKEAALPASNESGGVR